jgi:hypothetical protein
MGLESRGDIDQKQKMTAIDDSSVEIIDGSPENRIDDDRFRRDDDGFTSHYTGSTYSR